MASSTVAMNYGIVLNVADGFQTAHDVLQAVEKALEAAIQIATAAAFLSFGTSAGLIFYLKNIKAKATVLRKACKNFEGDLRGAQKDHQNGDYKSGTYFKQGITL
jgi:hypothetical protein